MGEALKKIWWVITPTPMPPSKTGPASPPPLTHLFNQDQVECPSWCLPSLGLCHPSTRVDGPPPYGGEGQSANGPGTLLRQLNPPLAGVKARQHVD